MTTAKRAIFASAVCCSAFYVNNASAAGFASARFGGEHGTPVSPNATAIYYNPANLALTEGIHLFVDGTLALRHMSYTHPRSPNDVADPVGGEGGNVGTATLFNVIASPMIGASAKAGDFGFGAGLYVPTGGVSSWDSNDKFANNSSYPGPVDGVQRWYSIDGTIRSMYLTAAVAYTVPSTPLSVGVSGNLIKSSINTIRARNGTGDNDMALEGRSLLDVEGWQGSFGVGATLEASEEKLWVSASYQARPNISGGMTLKGTLQNHLSGQLNVPTDVEVHQDLPDVFRAGIRWKPEKKTELRLFGDFTRWSAFKEQCIAPAGQECEAVDDPNDPDHDGESVPGKDPTQNLRRHWQDTFGVRAGLSRWVNPATEVFTGLGFDSNAVPDETLDPVLPDWNKVTAALGAKLEVIKNLHAALSYTHVFYIPRNNIGESKTASFKPPTRSPDAGGLYSQWIGVVNANVDVAF